MKTKKGNRDFLSLAKARKTTYKFSDREVKESDIKNALEAGRWSPSCSNNQPWHFVIVRDKKRISKIMRGVEFGDFHYDPPVIIAVVLISKLCSKDSSCFSVTGSPKHDSLICLGMAGLSIVLEAKDLGIDSCILTPDKRVVKKVLGINKEDSVPLLIGLGYRGKGAYRKKRTRRPLAQSVSYEHFGNHSRK